MTRSRLALLLAWLLAGVAFALATFANLRTSATVDEPNYVATGLSIWKTGDYRMHPDSPPLAPLLGGLAALTLGPTVPTEPGSVPDRTAAVVSATEAWRAADDWQYGARVIHDVNGPLARDLVLRARLPIALAGACLVLVAFLWARSLGGESAGLAAAFLAALEPTWLAHSAVLSCDVLASTLVAATVFATARALDGPAGSLGPRRAVLLGTLASLALASKFTALALAPILPLVALASAVLRRRAGDASAPPPAEVARLLLRVAAVALVLVAVAAYPGTFGLASYLSGVRTIYRNVRPGEWFFFLGESSHHGWPLYATASLALKTSLATLALGLAGAVVVVVRAGRAPASHRSLRSLGTLRQPSPGSASHFCGLGGSAGLAPLVLLAVILAGSLGDPAAYGVRRVLPALPALFVLGGVAVGAAVEATSPARGSRGRHLALAAAGLLLAAHAASSLRASPRFIPYTNEVARSLGEPTDFFSDSNVDWGQALPDLAREIEERRPARVKLDYFGPLGARPELLGIHAEKLTDADLIHPEPGVLYAISATWLVDDRRRVRAGELPPEADWLSRARPVARAGDAIYLYEVR